jgi:hypothetical protein
MLDRVAHSILLLAQPTEYQYWRPFGGGGNLKSRGCRASLQSAYQALATAAIRFVRPSGVLVKVLILLASREGFEPLTYGSKGRRIEICGFIAPCASTGSPTSGEEYEKE